jgi:hypothetical protein
MADPKKNNKEEIYIPIDLNDCMRELDSMLVRSDKLNIENMSEEKFLAISHFRLGMWMRNNWIFRAGSVLLKYFYTQGIYHPDYMSSIILIAYSRYVKGQALGVDELIRYYSNINTKRTD